MKGAILMMMLLTIKDLMRIFRCGKNYAYALTKLPGFPTLQIGKKIYIPADGLEKWVKENMGTKITLTSWKRELQAVLYCLQFFWNMIMRKGEKTDVLSGYGKNYGKFFKKITQGFENPWVSLIGATGFEPTTS